MPFRRLSHSLQHSKRLRNLSIQAYNTDFLLEQNQISSLCDALVHPECPLQRINIAGNEFTVCDSIFPAWIEYVWGKESIKIPSSITFFFSRMTVPLVGFVFPSERIVDISYVFIFADDTLLILCYT